MKTKIISYLLILCLIVSISTVHAQSPNVQTESVWKLTVPQRADWPVSDYKFYSILYDANRFPIGYFMYNYKWTGDVTSSVTTFISEPATGKLPDGRVLYNVAPAMSSYREMNTLYLNMDKTKLPDEIKDKFVYGTPTWYMPTATLNFNDDTLFYIREEQGNVIQPSVSPTPAPTDSSESSKLPSVVEGLKGIEVSPSKMTIEIDQTKMIKVSAVFKNGTRKDVTNEAEFFAQDTEIADVDEGVVTGISPGESRIAVNYGGIERNVLVEVVKEVGPVLEKLEVSERMVKLRVGQQQELYVTGIFDDESRDDVTGEVLWQRSKGSVVSVTDGIIAAKGIGVATITASLQGKKVQVKVTVEKAKKVKNLAISKTSLRIVEGQTVTVKVTATYVDNSKEDVTSKVIWNVIDSDVVDVKSGKFYALDLGTTKVTGKFDGKLVTVNVNVK